MYVIGFPFFKSTVRMATLCSLKNKTAAAMRPIAHIEFFIGQL